MAYHMKQLEDESSAGAKQSFVAEQVRRQQDTPQVGRLLSLYIDDSVPDPTPFGDVRQRAYKIMPRDTLQTRSEEHTSELQSQSNLVCRLLLEKKKKNKIIYRKESETK